VRWTNIDIVQWPATPIAAALLAVPISLGALFRWEINPAYLLAPIIAVVYLRNMRDRLNLAFLSMAICGFGSIIVANLLDPGHLVANSVNLILGTLFAPSFMFLGRRLSTETGIRAIVFWLALWSSIFLIVITVPLLIEEAPVRALNPDGTAFVNVRFLGLPIYATFGINSLTPLFCIQAAVISGAIFSVPRTLQIVFAAGIACAAFLVIGSDSRESSLSLLLLLPALICFGIVWRPAKIPMLLIVAALVLALGLSAARTSPGGGRLLASMQTTTAMVATWAGHGTPHTGASAFVGLDDLTKSSNP